MIIKQLIFGFYLLGVAVLQSVYAEPTQIRTITEITSEKLLGYITFVPSNTPVDWTSDNCDHDTLTHSSMNKRVIRICKIQEDSSYLMDSHNKTILVSEFTPIRAVDLGGAWGCICIQNLT